MSIKRTETVETFTATDSDGHPCKVIIRQDIIDAASQDDPHGELGGTKSAWLGDGRRLNRIDDDTFQIVGDDGVLNRRK